MHSYLHISAKIVKCFIVKFIWLNSHLIKVLTKVMHRLQTMTVESVFQYLLLPLLQQFYPLRNVRATDVDCHITAYLSIQLIRPSVWKVHVSYIVFNFNRSLRWRRWSLPSCQWKLAFLKESSTFCQAQVMNTNTGFTLSSIEKSILLSSVCNYSVSLFLKGTWTLYFKFQIFIFKLF